MHRIIQDILRKYLNSFSDNGFSGVSSGHNMNMQIADIIANIPITIWILYIFANAITITHTKKVSADSVSHFVSVDA